MPFLWIHTFRIVGGTILAPGAVDARVPTDFRDMIGYGDLATAALALLAVIGLRTRFPAAIALVRQDLANPAYRPLLTCPVLQGLRRGALHRLAGARRSDGPE